MASVHAAGERAVQLVWEALPAAADGLQPTAYEIHAAEQPPLWRLLRTVAADDAAAVGDDDHLVCTCDAPRARRTYYYTVRAVNAAGAGGLCHDNRFFAQVRGGVPSAVLRLRCEAVRATADGVLLTLVWNAPVDDGGVEIERFEARSPALRHTAWRRRDAHSLGKAGSGGWPCMRGGVQVVSKCGSHAQWCTHSAACEETTTADDGTHRLALTADAAPLCRVRVRAVNRNGAGAYSDELCVHALVEE